MFEITGIYSNTFYPNGTLNRMKKAFHMALNTESGVMAFIDEQVPFEEIKIRDAETKEDLTEYFMGEK